jgi:hypothetical protein
MKLGADISVVVQGPLHGRPDESPEKQITRRSLDQLRSFWPDCEIILSTWAGADAGGITYDHLVENPDPGAISLNDGQQKSVFNNLNRQIVSTRNGLARATRRYALKLRTDCSLSHPIDFSQLDRGRRDPDWCLLEKPVITLHTFTRHPLRRPVLFHLSDLFFAGLTTDLRTLWEIPLVEEPGFTRSIDPAQRPRINAFPEADYLFRCAPEQYVAEQLARKKFPDLNLRHHSDGSVDSLFIWLRLLANNFRVLTLVETGTSLPPHIARHTEWWDLIRSQDQGWFELWTRSRVPIFTRVSAACRFRLLQLAFMGPLPRSLWQRALGRAVRSFS